MTTGQTPSNDRRHVAAATAGLSVQLLTALHLIALLCGGRVAHGGRLMVESLGSGLRVLFFPSRVVA